ncbi:dipeptidase A [Liquorilactobacillus capillatus DSM 19910]|uniref:Dipeptidase n=1 Tax=Liquorilactobacillus capillatus DSM 19910 TaxID=1423731 RepID=A0A0R1LWE2_9LACO|nr:dipeptidase A [Liquorilactobacillus capillatus DSM 19910]
MGKKATADGSTLIARNEDAKSAWPKHLVVHPHQEFEEPQTFVSPDNGFTITLPQVSGKYTATPEWTSKFGIFEEDGINEYGVAMSATESAYANERVLGADPLVKKGIGEEAMVTVTLPYIHSAREGVAYLGHIVEKYGASETNGVLFSDQDEVWYMEIATGHYWVAQRIPDDAYAVVANQLAIQNIDFTDSTNYMYAQGIAAFVQENDLSVSHNEFNFRKIFGTQELSDEIYSTPRVWYGQKYLTPTIKQEPMSEELPFIQRAQRLLHNDDLEYILGSHFQGTAYDPLNSTDLHSSKRFRPISLAKTQESHILQLRPNLPPEISGLHWLALGVTAQSIFVPFYAGMTDTHPAYKEGTATYSFSSAYWRYKLLGVLVDAHYKRFGPELTALQKELRILFKKRIRQNDLQAQTLPPEKLATFLTTASTANAQLGLDKVDKLTAQLITAATELSPLNFQTDENL